jgi:hypothetical protein
MRDRLHFARRAMGEGFEWLAGVADHIGRLLTVVALVVGLPAGLALVALGWWAVAVSVALLALLVFSEGAFRAWHRLDQDVNRDFPRHALKIDPPWSGEIPVTSVATGHTPRLLFVPLTFTNREPTRRVSLQFELLWTRVFGGEQILGPYISRLLACRWATDPRPPEMGRGEGGWPGRGGDAALEGRRAEGGGPRPPA